MLKVLLHRIHHGMVPYSTVLSKWSLPEIFNGYSFQKLLNSGSPTSVSGTTNNADDVDNDDGDIDDDLRCRLSSFPLCTECNVSTDYRFCFEFSGGSRFQC